MWKRLSSRLKENVIESSLVLCYVESGLSVDDAHGQDGRAGRGPIKGGKPSRERECNCGACALFLRLPRPTR